MARKQKQQPQKSEVHETTNDASSSPASDARTPARGGGRPDHVMPAAAPDREIDGEIGGGPGAGDGSSGGGAGAGIPGGGTEMRMGDKIRPGDVDADRERLFPGAGRDPEDESDFGGALDLDDPDATQ